MSAEFVDRFQRFWVAPDPAGGPRAWVPLLTMRFRRP